jgi:pimeloyl-ACP methyl ester carboxylesterase
VQNAQLKGIALSANPQSPALDTSKPVVLFFGGSGARVEEAAYGAAKICGSDAGLNFVSVNYRGFGDSTSIAPTPRTLIEDAKTAYSHLRDLGFPPEKIILRGYSLGATAAGHLHAMSELKGEKLGGVIYDRPMPSAQKAAAGATGYTAAGWLTKMLAGSFGASPNLRVMDHFIGRSERKAPVLVIADNGTHPNNDFLGAAATEMAQQYGLDLVQSRGDHFMHDEANQAAQSFLGRLN